MSQGTCSGIEHPEAIADGEVKVIIISTPVGAIVGNVHPPERWDLVGPQDGSVVGIESNQAVHTLVKEAAIGCKGRWHARAAVDTEVSSGVTDPLDGHA